MKKNGVKILFVIILLISLGNVLTKKSDELKAEEVTTPTETPTMIDNNKLLKPRRDINDSWPGQTMMDDLYELKDDDWEKVDISVLNSTNSLSVFDIDVEGFEGLRGHIRFGGVDEGSMRFEQAQNKQMRGLVFVVENTKQFVGNDPKKNTIKYTYNYSFGNNATYMFRPITAGAVMPNSVDPSYSYESSASGEIPNQLAIAEIYRQKTNVNGIYAIQARSREDVGITGTDFKAQVIKTVIPNRDGGVRIVNEIKNTRWETGKENTPRRSFGLLLAEDTKLNAIDDVPIYSLGSNKGVYIANRKDLFRVSFPRVPLNEAAADNYEGQWYNSVVSSGRANSRGDNFPAFRRNSSGVGTEAQDLPLDTRVWPTALNGGTGIPQLRPPLDNPTATDKDEMGWDTQYAQKWIPREPPEVGEKAITAYDVNVLPIYKPEIKIDIASQNQSAHKDAELTFTGTWRDMDSLNVKLYYQIGNGEWQLFAEDSRGDNDTEKLVWRPFELKLPANKFKLTKDTISFKAVDTTQVSSDIAKTDVNVFEKVKINAEHYVPDPANPGGYILKETVEQEGIPKTEYQTKALNYTADGLTLDRVDGEEKAITPTTDVTVKYYYKKGVVTVTTKYVKEDGSELLPDDKVLWDYNQTYTTDDKKAEALAQDYYYKERTGGAATGPTGTEDKEIIVTYHYRIGVLGIVAATETLDLGTNDLISIGIKDIYPTTDTKLTILDELKGNWNLELRISKAFKSGEEPLKGDLYFNTKDKGEVKLNSAGQAVHSRGSATAGQVDLVWSKQAKEGLFYRQVTGNQKGQYEGKLEWNIVSAP